MTTGTFDLTDLTVFIATIDEIAADLVAMAAAGAWPVRFQLGSPPPPTPAEIIQPIAAQEKAAALDWWDTHLDALYAGMGLPRDLNLIRGEN